MALVLWQIEIKTVQHIPQNLKILISAVKMLYERAVFFIYCKGIISYCSQAQGFRTLLCLSNTTLFNSVLSLSLGRLSRHHR